jgi:hypothetical protein
MNKIFAISCMVCFILLIPHSANIKAQQVTPPQIEMFLTTYGDEAGEIEYVGEEDIDYKYKGEGFILIYIEFYAPDVFEVILTKNLEVAKFWSSGIFENDSVEHVWDTSLDGTGKYEWSFVAYNFGSIPVVNNTVVVEIEQGFLTPRRLFFGIIAISVSLVAVAFFMNQRTKKMRKNR